MAYKILTSTVSADSATKLRDKIEKILKMKPKTIRVSKDSGACLGHKVILRYGCGYGSVNPEPEWNSKEFVNLCIDKLAFSKKFGMVNVPEFCSVSHPQEFPVMIRETLLASKSEGCHIVHNMAEFRRIWIPNFYWTKFYADKEFELRILLVVVMGQYHLRIYKKVPVDGTETDTDFLVQGENTVWKLRNPESYPKVIKIVEKMIPTIIKSGGRFTGIDMIYVPSLKDYVVLEMNSGPWLTDSSAEWLANLFVENQWAK